MKVRCIKLLDVNGEPTNESGWAKIGATYHVLSVWVGSRDAGFRLIGEDRHTPALFEPEMFEIVSPIIPPTWVIASSMPGTFDIAPEPWTHKGFWERYFDFDPEAEAC